MMRIIVCGGREYDDREKVVKALMGLPMGTVLVHGGATGADTLAANVWESWGGDTEAHPAKWKQHGKGAGPKRNQEIVDAGANRVIAFPGGAGTADMIQRAEKASIRVIKIPARKESKDGTDSTRA